MEDNLEQFRNNLKARNDEYSEKTAEWLAKHEVENLNKHIFEIDVHLENLYGQKNSGVWTISNLSCEINNQQQRIASKKSVFASNSYLLSHSNAKTLPFSITTNMAGKRKVAPLSDEIPPCAKRCNETYDACSLIHAGCKDDKVAILNGILETVGRKFSSTLVVSELNNGKNAITRKLSRNFINSWHNNVYKSNENRVRSLNVYYSHNVMGEAKI